MPATQQFEYEIRAWCDDAECDEDGVGIWSFETTEMRDKHVAGLEAVHEGIVIKTGWGIYRRPLKADSAGIRELEHVADFEYEDEAKDMLAIIQALSAPKIVKVSVTGGVASVDELPEGVEVLLTDYDDEEVTDEQAQTVRYILEDGAVVEA